MMQINLKFCAPFKIKKREGLYNFKKPVFDFFLYYIQERTV